MRISSSVGSVTSMAFLLLEVFEDVVQLVEPLRPQPLEPAHPVVDGLERPAVDPVDPAPSHVADVDRPHLAEHAQVLGHLRLAQPERLDEVVDGALPAGEHVEDLTAAGLRHRVERVGRRRCSGHAPLDTYPYGYVSNGSASRRPNSPRGRPRRALAARRTAPPPRPRPCERR